MAKKLDCAALHPGYGLAHGLTLVTANQTELRRVPGLAVESWLSHGALANAPFGVQK